MLLDLAHAQISAFNLGWGSPQAYLSALPLGNLREIHINHPSLDGEKQMLDTHLPVQASDLDLLGWTLARTPHAEAVTLETETASEAELLQQVALLRQISG